MIDFGAFPDQLQCQFFTFTHVTMLISIAGGGSINHLHVCHKLLVGILPSQQIILEMMYRIAKRGCVMLSHQKP
jgi:hypothetical protein